MRTDALVDTFLSWNERHRSDSTVRFYRQRLKRLKTGKLAEREFESLKPLEVDEYLCEAGKGQSDTTRRHDIVAFQTMHNFALREKLIEKPIVGKLEKPRGGRRERIPTPEEIARLLEHARPDFKRMYHALCRCGARPGELCKARIEDIHWEKNVIVLLEHKTARKTGKPRKIGIGDKLRELMKEAIGERTSGPIFLTARGRPWKPAHLSAEHRKYRDAAGLDPEIVLYLARHRFGTLLIQAGEDIKTVADMMGHAGCATTERYIHREPEELRLKQDLID